jgi:hypothetical protein
VPLVHQLQHLPPVHLGHHHVEQHEVGAELVEHLHPVLGATGLVDDVALHLEVDADVFAQPLVVVDDQHDRARVRFGRRALEKRIEVVAAVAAVPARRLEGAHTAAVRPLADRALGDAEIARGLAQREPIGLAERRLPAWVVTGHFVANLPKAFVSETSVFTAR